jgi:hypothetical protein
LRCVAAAAPVERHWLLLLLWLHALQRVGSCSCFGLLLLLVRLLLLLEPAGHKPKCRLSEAHQPLHSALTCCFDNLLTIWPCAPAELGCVLLIQKQISSTDNPRKAGDTRHNLQHLLADQVIEHGETYIKATAVSGKQTAAAASTHS